MYDSYKIARNKSWEVLIDAGVDRLPVDLKKVCKSLHAVVILYSNMGEKTLSNFAATGDGFTLALNKKQKLIAINDFQSLPRMRFTLAHELGHIALNHPLTPVVYRNSELDDNQKVEEVQANIFARDILMPACALAKLDIHTAEDIAKLCDVSLTSAQIRAERMKTLYQRNMFGAHPLERQVISQFKKFISSKK